MEKQRWEESERRREEGEKIGGEKEWEERRCRHTRFGALFEVEMSEKWTPLWREAYFQVKMYQAHQVRSSFWHWDVEKVHAIVARSTLLSQNVKSTTCWDHFWRFRCSFAWHAQGILHLAKSEQNVKVCSSFNYNHHYTTLHYTTLDYTTLHTTATTTTTTALHYTTLHCTALHYTH